MKVFAALHGLGRDYEPIKTITESKMDSCPTPTFEDIIPRFTSYDDRLRSYASQSTITPRLAFYTDRDRNQYYRSRGRNQGRERGSFSTRGRGFHQHVGSSTSSSVSSVDSDMPVCQICGRLGHNVLRCWHKFDNIYQHDDMPSALAALRITDVSNSLGLEWFPDSAATAHVTSSPCHLQHAQAYTGSDAIMVGNGEFLPITHTGSTSLTSTSGKIPPNDVLVSPDIAKSLISVSKMTKDFPCSVDFDCDYVRVIDKETKRLLFQGNHSNGLYALPSSSPQA